MAEAVLWGGLAAATLLLGAVIAFLARPSAQVNAIVMALGAGVLLGSVAYELVEESLKTRSLVEFATALLLGSGAFVVGSILIARMGGRKRKSMTANHDADAAKGIVLGSVLDGIPESLVLGLTVATGGVSIPFFAGVALSNLPEGMASSTGLEKSGFSRGRIIGMWLLVVVASGVSAGIGYTFLTVDSRGGGLAQAFAAGALLTMITDTMLPEAYAEERNWTGALVVVGFALSVALGSI